MATTKKPTTKKNNSGTGKTPAKAKSPSKIAAPAKPAPKPASRPVAKPAAKPVAKPIAKPAAKPTAKPAAKPAPKATPKAAAKPAAKPVAKAAPKTPAKPAQKSAPKAVSKAAPKATPASAKPVASKAKPAPAPAKKTPPAKAPAKAAPAKKPTGKTGHGLPLPPPPPPPDRFKTVRQAPLTARQVEGFRARLAVELDYIKGNLDALTRDALKQQSESAGDVGIHSTHMADHGTDNFDRDINLLLASGRQEAIYAIEDALRRMAGGSFGICEVCGNPIGFERLNAMPYAKMCIACKKELEKGRGRPTFSPYPSEKTRTRPVETPDGEQEAEIEVDMDADPNEMGDSRLPTD